MAASRRGGSSISGRRRGTGSHHCPGRHGGTGSHHSPGRHGGTGSHHSPGRHRGTSSHHSPGRHRGTSSHRSPGRHRYGRRGAGRCGAGGHDHSPGRERHIARGGPDPRGRPRGDDEHAAATLRSGSGRRPSRIRNTGGATADRAGADRADADRRAGADRCPGPPGETGRSAPSGPGGLAEPHRPQGRDTTYHPVRPAIAPGPGSRRPPAASVRDRAARRSRPGRKPAALPGGQACPPGPGRDGRSAASGKTGERATSRDRT